MAELKIRVRDERGDQEREKNQEVRRALDQNGWAM